MILIRKTIMFNIDNFVVDSFSKEKLDFRETER